VITEFAWTGIEWAIAPLASMAFAAVPMACLASTPAERSSVHPAEQLLAALGKVRFTSQTFADHAGATRRPTIRHGPWEAQRSPP
jgi:hypothetical protein